VLAHVVQAPVYGRQHALQEVQATPSSVQKYPFIVPLDGGVFVDTSSFWWCNVCQ